MPGMKIGILGIGGEGSLGFTFSKRLIGDKDIMSSSGLEQIIIKRRCLRDRAEEAQRVKDFFKDQLFRDAEDKSLNYMKKAQPSTSLKELFETDMIFLCYGAYGVNSKRVPFWEPGNRQKFYRDNWPMTEQIISELESMTGKKMKEHFKGQIVFLTNPSFQLANSFLQRTGLDPKQVLAFSPDHERLRMELRGLAAHNSDIANHIDKSHGETDVFPSGEHGDNLAAFLPHDLSKYAQTISEKLQAVVEEGPELFARYDGTSGTVVPHLKEFVKSCINAWTGSRQSKLFNWGVYYNGVFCTLPFVNVKTKDAEGREFWRAEIMQNYLNEFKSGKRTLIFPSNMPPVEAARRSRLGLEGLTRSLHDDEENFKNEGIRYSVAVANLIGGGFQTCGYDTEIRSIPFKGDVIKFESSNSALAAIVERALAKQGSEKSLMYWSDISKAPVECRIEKPGDENFAYKTHSLALDTDGSCYVGTCFGRKGRIARYKNGAPANVETEKVLPFAIVAGHDCIYCSTGSKILCLDKEKLEAIVDKNNNPSAIPVTGLAKGSIISELRYSGNENNQILSARTRSTNGKSGVLAWLNGKQLNISSTSPGAFEAALAGGKVTLFYADKNKIRVESAGLKPQDISLVDPVEVKSLRFDSAMNYLYASTSTQIYLIPFNPKKHVLIDNTDKIKYIEQKQFGKEIRDFRAGALWS